MRSTADPVSLSRWAIATASYRLPATASAGTAASIRASNRGVSVTGSAPSDSASRARVRAPTSGTMSSPRLSTQAIATCATVTPCSSATARSASTSRRFASRLSPWKRGECPRKSPALSSRSGWRTYPSSIISLTAPTVSSIGMSGLSRAGR